MRSKYLCITKVYEEAEKRLEDLLKAKEVVRANIKNHPEGTLRFFKHGNRFQFFIRGEKKGKGGTYLSKKEKKTIRQYLQKWYDLRVLKLLDSEISSMEAVLKTSEISNEIQKIYSDSGSEIKEYIQPVDISDEEYANEWMAIPYEKMTVSDDLPQYITDNGERVRSKSELTIANALARVGIPYKYECPLTLRSGITVHPDFTVLCVNRRKVVYWEHRGMMDDEAYARHAVRKIKDYAASGIYLGDTLFVTEETQQSPLGTNEIKSTIKLILKS